MPGSVTVTEDGFECCGGRVACFFVVVVVVQK